MATLLVVDNSGYVDKLSRAIPSTYDERLVRRKTVEVVMATKKQMGIFETETLLSRLLASGFVELPCRVLNESRWQDEWLVFLSVPVPEGEPQRILYTAKENVRIISGDPDSEEGAVGKLQAPISVETTRRAHQRNEALL